MSEILIHKGSIIYMGVEKEIKNSINNFTTFRPEIKDVKIKKVELFCDISHVYGIRTDIRHNCCGRKKKSTSWQYMIQTIS